MKGRVCVHAAFLFPVPRRRMCVCVSGPCLCAHAFYLYLQASGPATLPEAVPDFCGMKDVVLRACPSRCREAPIGVDHALSCLTVQLTRTEHSRPL